MRTNKNISFYHILFPFLCTLPFAFMLMNCARESSPTGGPLDSIPPYVLSEKPKNNSNGIYPQKITLKLNEFIELDNIEDNCMISPVFEKKPDITAKKKKIQIDLSKQKLKPNTTYSFNFSNAIKDLTEENITEQYIYAFSTGAGIDTMKIAGKVSYAKSQEMPESAYVLLYDNLSDTAFSTQKPRYVTKISKKGTFSFSNIEAKSYRIYALEDSDKDFIFNQPAEKIAFIDTLFSPTAERFMDTVWFTHNDTTYLTDYEDSIQITSVKDSFKLEERTRWSDQDIQLSLFENETWEQDLLSFKRISKYAVACKFATYNNLPTDFYCSQSNNFLKEVTDNDSITLWLLDTTLMVSDSAIFITKYKTSDNSNKIQTDTIRIEPIKDMPARLEITSSTTQNDKVFAHDSIFITTSRPLKETDFEKIHLYTNCDTSKENNYIVFESKNNYKFKPKYHYQKQTILKHKEQHDRFAIYFSKPIKPEDVKITLEGLPNLKDWFYCELDEQSNALLFWLKPGTDALRLKNTAIEVQYPDSEGKVVTKSFNSKKEVPVQKMYKKPTTVKKIIVQISDNQKERFIATEPLRIVCNNPVKEINDSLFSLIDIDDSTETSIITKVSINKDFPRIILIEHSAEEGKHFSLTMLHGAVTDTFGISSRKFSKELSSEISDRQYLKDVPLTITPHGNNNRAFSIIPNEDWKAQTNYNLVISDSAFTDIFGDANDSINFVFQSPTMENFGSLIVKSSESLNNLIFILENTENAKQPLVFTGTRDNNNIAFYNIPTGKYSLKCFEDVNNNKKWDTGCIEIKRQPEKNFFYKESVEIKSERESVINWDNIK